NSITKNNGINAWDGGAVSSLSIQSGDGSIQVTANNTSDVRMFGLGNGDSSQSYTDIEYAIYMYSDGSSYIYESGTYKGKFDNYTTGDTFKVSVESGVVKYYHNAHLEYTSSVAPTYPLLLDTSIYNSGGSISNAIICGTLALGFDTAPNGKAGKLNAGQTDMY